MKLAVIHTTPVTIEPLKELAAELLEDCTVHNIMDDSILPRLAETGGDLEAVKERLLAYAAFAEQSGADCILSACSSVGEAVAAMRGRVGIPVVRIDDEMAERAVRAGGTIGVAATLGTTLKPTVRLLETKADEAGVRVSLKPALAEDAYRKLMAGDKAGHDEALAAVLTKLAGETDVVVLAQASMARVVGALPEALRPKFLTSPRAGMERVKATLENGSRGADKRVRG